MRRTTPRAARTPPRVLLAEQIRGRIEAIRAAAEAFYPLVDATYERRSLAVT